MQKGRALRMSIIVILTIMTWFISGRFFSKIAVATSESLNYRVFMLKDPTDNTKGGYVRFIIPAGYLVQGEAIKRIACTPGEILKVSGREYYCNNEYLGKAKETGRKGQKLVNFVFNGPIPEGELFVMGDHKDSYDSRYFGFIKRAEIQADANPLF